MQEHIQPQHVPVKVYRTSERLTVAAPMPGLEPENIVVEVTGDGRLVLRGELRAAFKDEKQVLADEWNPGPYHREVALPAPVNGEMANVTYNNGVLVVVSPVAERTQPARLLLEPVGPIRGERVGNVGHDVRPTTTAEHQAARAAVRTRAGGVANPHGL
ncbi:MAG: Hsp20/alpha crystallin family protein [Chloroflexi bacterium]|nr:Hsp20/alpha crystallin family protein [Chloroflexota bacterium]